MGLAPRRCSCQRLSALADRQGRVRQPPAGVPGGNRSAASVWRKWRCMLSEAERGQQALPRPAVALANCHLSYAGELSLDHRGIARTTEPSTAVVWQWPGGAEESERGDLAGVAREAPAAISRQRELALALLRRSRHDGLPFAFVACDGGYGHLLLRELDGAGATFVAEMHADHAIYLDDPLPQVAEEAAGRSTLVRASLRLRSRPTATSAIAWMSACPSGQWCRLSISDGGKRKLRADYLTQRVWVWDGKSASADYWQLLLRRAMDGQTLSFCLTNAQPGASLRELAEMLARALASRGAPARRPRARSVWQW